MNDEYKSITIKCMYKLLFDIQQILNAPPGVYGTYERLMLERIKDEIEDVLALAADSFGFKE